MKLLLVVTTLALMSCGADSSKKKDPSYNDSVNRIIDSPAKTNPVIPTVEKKVATETALSRQVNEILNSKPGSKWHVLNDRDAHWISGQFDHFIAPKRKEDPDYPYIAKADFNGDGKADIAAMAGDISKNTYQIMIIFNADEANPKISVWQDDITVYAAISVFPKSNINGFDVDGGKAKTIKMKSDGINVEYFETASFVLYWNGTAFKRVQTGD